MDKYPYDLLYSLWSGFRMIQTKDLINVEWKECKECQDGKNNLMYQQDELIDFDYCTKCDGTGTQPVEVENLHLNQRTTRISSSDYQYKAGDIIEIEGYQNKPGFKLKFKVVSTKGNKMGVVRI